MIDKKDLIRLNKLFDDGVLVNESSLDFALSSIKKTKNWLEQLSYIVRALIVDHPFRDGNKRTAGAVIIAYFNLNNLEFDEEKIVKLVIELAKKSIIDIRKIRRKIKNVIFL